jgi:hypothetical protein
MGRSLPNNSQITTSISSSFVRQSSGQPNFPTEEKVLKAQGLVTFSNRPIPEKGHPSGFFTSSAITYHLINSAIIVTK